MTSTPAPASSGASSGTVPVVPGSTVVAPTIDIVRAVVGGVFLGIFAYWQWQNPALLKEPVRLEAFWSEMLLLLAALVIVPLTVGIFLKSVTPATVKLWELIERMHLSAAAVLIGAYLMVPGIAVASLTLPWLAMTCLYALTGIVAIRERGTRCLWGLTINVAFIFLAIGGVWVVVERAGMRPWGFESNIEILTALHFHYAGFVLLLAAGWAAKELNESLLAKAACIAAMIGVPLTAAGILAAKLGYGSALETVAAVIMALAGALVAWMHLLLAGRAQYTPLVRGLWSVAAASLIAAMVLATLYGLRSVYPIKILDIPHMRAIHGTLNAVGFGFCVICAWRSRFRRPRTASV
ncbi:MAG: YndJ family protein [Planctomycetia bacterium]|nr:YndJ family protein [Planctomycetia bacterium]